MKVPIVSGESGKFFEQFDGEEPHAAAADNLIEDADMNSFSFHSSTTVEKYG